VLTGVVVLVAVMAALCAFGIIYKNRNGRLRPRGTATPAAGNGGPVTLTETELGSPLGGRATLVQFSSAFCAPCRATRVILGDVAGLVDGVTHVEIDAESRLDLVRRLDIRRTPTVLVLGAGGQIVQRGSGQPRKADVIAALGRAEAGGVN
jgi:thiol-disulfide isomerase/thioredoxin